MSRRIAALLVALSGLLAMTGFARSAGGLTLATYTAFAVTQQPRLSHLMYQIEGNSGADVTFTLVKKNKYLSVAKATDHPSKDGNAHLFWKRNAASRYPVKSQRINLWISVSPKAPKSGSGSWLCLTFWVTAHRAATETDPEVTDPVVTDHYCSTTKQWSVPVSQR